MISSKLFTVFLCVFAAYSLIGQNFDPTEYEINKAYKETVFFDDFLTNKNKWRIQIGNRSFRKIENGHMQCWSHQTNTPEYWPSAFSLKNLNVDYNKNFQIEGAIKCIEYYKSPISLIWNRNSETFNTYYFGFTNDQEFRISHYHEGSFHGLSDFIVSKHIKQDGYNRLTVRKYKDKFYFFINKALVYELPAVNIEFTGNKIGFQAPSNSVINVDFFEVSYIGNANYTILMKQYVNKKLDRWKQKGKFEKTETYQKRISKENRNQFIAKQVDHFLDSAGREKKPVILKKNDYNADNEFFTLHFTNGKKITLEVPIDEAREFDENFDSIQITPQYTIAGNQFQIHSIDFINPANDQTYHFDGLYDAFDITTIFPDYKKVDKVIVARDTIVEKIKHTEIRLQDELKQYTEELITNEMITDNIRTKVKAEVKEEVDSTGESHLNYHVQYSYNVVKAVIENVTDDFPPGEYRLATSKAAMATMQLFKETIEKELQKYLETNTKITFKITGSTDATPIKNVIPYQGEFGNFRNEVYFINDNLSTITITEETGVTNNKQLAFLRTYGVRNFIENYVTPLRVTQNRFQHYAEVASEKGAAYRKIAVEIIIHDAFKGKTREELFADKAQKQHSPVDVNIPRIVTENRNTYAVVIGNEDYSSYQKGIDKEMNVKFARNDARIFSKYLHRTLGLPEKNIMTLLDATAAKFHQSVAWLQNIADVTDGEANIVFYYSGHGLPYEKTKAPYMIPVDVSGSQVQYGYSLDTLYHKLGAMDVNKSLVIIDACFSGGARNKSLVQVKGVKIKPRKSLVNGNLIAFTSSSGQQSSGVYDEQYHGLFTYFLLKNLRESAGNITIDSLAHKVKKQVSRESVLVNNKKQVPRILVSPEIDSTWTQWSLSPN